MGNEPLSRSEYYEQMKALARDTRIEYGLTTPRVMKSDLRRIYKDQRIHIDLWDHKFKQMRGAYFNDDLGPTVVIAKGLPDDPTIFTMAHELKHHLADRHLTIACCETNPRNEMIEIGAEVFAAEFIFPEEDFTRILNEMGVTLGNCTAESLVHLKRQTQTTLSYAGLSKRAEFLRFATRGAFAKVMWKKLEEQIYGEPMYKRIQRWRSNRFATRGQFD
jgi:Zn-dependent peptidase ImmA (M78 family)